MNLIKKFSALAAASTAIALLLGTSPAWAETVCVDGDTATGIKDLTLVTKEFGTVNVDVNFRYETGWSVYGSDLGRFPFDGENSEEDALLTMGAINDALNAVGDSPDPIPDFAGQPGKNTFYIGVEEETELNEGFIAAVGGANYSSTLWTRCEEEGADNCVLGAAILEADQNFTYAALSRTDGSTCTNAPPPEPPPAGSFDIIPCITGSWYLLARDGQGYNIEILGSGLDMRMLAYFYTYDDDGDQMWLVGEGDVDGDTAVVPVQRTSGPSYGDDYNPADVVRENWGTLTFTFTSKDTGTVARSSTTGFGTTIVDIDRLTSVSGLSCP